MSTYEIFFEKGNIQSRFQIVPKERPMSVSALLHVLEPDVPLKLRVGSEIHLITRVKREDWRRARNERSLGTVETTNSLKQLIITGYALLECTTARLGAPVRVPTVQNTRLGSTRAYI